MLPFASPPPSPSSSLPIPLEKRRYAPLTPSPLNPNTPPPHLGTIHHHNQARKATSNNNTNTNTQWAPLKTSIPLNKTQQRYLQFLQLSPTQRLLRQKAAVAWRRAEILRLQHYQQHQYHHILAPCQSGSGQHPHGTEAEAAAAAAAAGLATKAGSYYPPLGAVSFASDGVKHGYDKQRSRAGQRENGGGGGCGGGGWRAGHMLLTVGIPLSGSDDQDKEENGDGESDIGLLTGGKRCDFKMGSGFGSPASDLNWRGYGDGGTTPRPGVDGGFDAEFGGVESGRDHRFWGEDGIGREDKRRRARGTAGVTLWRMFLVVVMVVGLVLVHGVVRAFGSGGGGGGASGRPLPDS